MNNPTFNFPDGKFDTTKGSIPEELGVIREYYGQPKYSSLSASEGRPLDSTTLAYEYEGNNEHITDILHFNFVNGSGWFFQFAPLRRTNGMNQKWSIYTLDRHAMEPAPEDTAPREVTHRREDREEGLTRYSTGATARHDWFKRPEGRQLMDLKYSSMVSGGWIAAKLIIGQAVINGKLHWQEWESEYGTRYANVLEAMQNEIEQFGALSKDSKAIYKLHGMATEIVKEASVDFNMIVLAKGSLNFLAFSTQFETEVYRRGEAVVQNRLALGAKSMTNLFPGVTIWEDEIFSLQNVGPDQINQFVRIASIGRYMMVDGSDFGEHMDSYPASKVLSLSHASMDIDAYKKLSIYTMIDKCCRWKPGTDEKSDFIQALVNTHGSVLQQSGIKLHHEDFLDPYIWRDTSYDNPKSPSSSGYHVIEHWGDMDKHYFTVRQNALFGERISKLVKKELKDTELEEIRQLKALMDQLYNVEETVEESVEGFMFAVTANPENTPTRPGSNMLKGNKFGCAQIPFVDVAVGQEMNKLIPGEDSPLAGSAMPNGALYVHDPKTQRRQYVWAIYPENLEPNPNGDGTFILRTSRNDPVLRGLEKAALENFSAIDNSNVYSVPSDITSFGPGGHPAFYVLAPLAMFGKVETDGTAPEWYDHFPDQVSVIRQAASGGVKPGDIDAPAPLKVKHAGIRSVKLVSAPGAPVGYGLITGMRTLAQLHNDGNYRGWSKEMCQTAAKGIRSADKLARILMRISPKCELLNEKYAMRYMTPENGPTETTKIDNILSNLWDHVKYPTWSRVPGPVDVGVSKFPLGIDTDISGLRTLEQQDLAHVDSLSDDDLQAVLDDPNMGFTNKGGKYEIGGTNIPAATLMTSLKQMLTHPSIDQTVRENILDARKRRRLLIDYSKDGSVGSAYFSMMKKSKNITSTNLSTSLKDSPNRRSLAVAIANSLSQMQPDQAVNVLNGLISMVNSPNKPTPDGIQSLIAKAKAIPSVKKSAFKPSHFGIEDQITRTSQFHQNAQDTNLFINTRLAISDRVWHVIAAEAAIADDAPLLRLSNHTLRPSDPANPNIPLAGLIPNNPNPGGFVAMKDNLGLLQHARQAQKGRITGTVFGSLHMTGIRGSEGGYAPEEPEEVDRDIATHKYSAFKKQKQHMPPTMMNDVSGPIYGSTPASSDSEERPTDDGENVVYKKWLLYRFEKLSEKVSDDIARMGSLMLCLTKVCKSSLTNWVKEGLPIPDCCYIFAQPWIRIRTSSGLWAEGGKSTAETGYNYEDVVLSFNGLNKLWNIHYTLWLNCSVYDPTKYLIMRDIKFEGYVGGMDDTINDDPTEWDSQKIDWNSVKSAFVFSCGANWSREMALKTANPLCLYGKYDPRGLPQNFANRNQVFSPDGPLWPSFPYYNLLWDFTAINANNEMDYSSFATIRASTYIPGIMPMANHLVYDEVTRDLTKKISGTGHLDAFEPPFKSILNGKIPFMNNKHL